MPLVIYELTPETREALGEDSAAALVAELAQAELCDQIDAVLAATTPVRQQTQQCLHLPGGNKLVVRRSEGRRAYEALFWSPAFREGETVTVFSACPVIPDPDRHPAGASVYVVSGYRAGHWCDLLREIASNCRRDLEAARDAERRAKDQLIRAAFAPLSQALS